MKRCSIDVALTGGEALPPAYGRTALIDPPTGADDRHLWRPPTSHGRDDLLMCWHCQRCGARFVLSREARMLRTSYRRGPDTAECRGGFSDVPRTLVQMSGQLLQLPCDQRDTWSLTDLARGAGWVNRSGRFDEIGHIYALGDDSLSRAQAQAFGPGLWEWELADEDEPQLPDHIHKWIWDPPTTMQEIDYGRCACGLLVRCETPSVPGRTRRQFLWNSDAMESERGHA